MKTPVLGAFVLALGAPVSAQTFTLLGDGIPEAISADGTTIVGGGTGAWYWTEATGQVSIGGFVAEGVSADGSTLFGDEGSSSDAGATWDAANLWQGIGSISGSGCPSVGSPYAFSDVGDVGVGLGWDGCDAFAYKWTAGTGVTNLGQLGPNSSRANNVSGDGTHVGGWDEAANGSRRAALWLPNGSETLLLENTPNNALGSGEVWGMSTDAAWISGIGTNGTGAFRWSQATGVQYLGGIAGFPGATGMGISDDGKTVVGFAGIAFSGITGLIWTESGGMQRFSDYAASLGFTPPPGTDFQLINDISADGRKMVGYIAADAGPFSPKFAFLLELPEECGFDTYGAGASPVNTLDLAGGGDTNVGGTFLATTSGNNGTVTVTFVSLDEASFPFLGGVGLFDPLQLVTFLVEAPVAGVSTNNVPIPPNPALALLDVYFQSVADDGGQPEGAALSNGLVLTICP